MKKNLNKDNYLNALLTKQISTGLNKGFRVVNKSMYTHKYGMVLPTFTPNEKCGRMALPLCLQIPKFVL